MRGGWPGSIDPTHNATPSLNAAEARQRGALVGFSTTTVANPYDLAVPEDHQSTNHGHGIVFPRNRSLKGAFPGRWRRLNVTKLALSGPLSSKYTQ